MIGMIHRDVRSDQRQTVLEFLRKVFRDHQPELDEQRRLERLRRESEPCAHPKRVTHPGAVDWYCEDCGERLEPLERGE